MDAQVQDEATTRNEVTLRGRLSAEATEKVMPSGDTMCALRIAVDRTATDAGRQRVDAIECVVWRGRVKRSCATWRLGDVVEVQGALRRRFFQTGAGAASRVEVEVTGGRVIRRAAT